MYWKNDPNGSGYRIRQFDSPAKTNMRSFAMDELDAPKRRRAKRSLRLMLPAWLTGRTVKDAEEMAENMKQTERND